MAVIGGSFGEGTGRIWLDSVQCTGSERELRNCTSNSNGINSCTHVQDAGVRCLPGMGINITSVFEYCYINYLQGCIEGDVRLVNGHTRYEGRVEICANNIWGTVCRNGWSSTDTRVVCRQLGFNSAGNLYLFAIT